MLGNLITFDSTVSYRKCLVPYGQKRQNGWKKELTVNGAVTRAAFSLLKLARIGTQ